MHRRQPTRALLRRRGEERLRVWQLSLRQIAACLRPSLNREDAGSGRLESWSLRGLLLLRSASPTSRLSRTLGAPRGAQAVGNCLFEEKRTAALSELRRLCDAELPPNADQASPRERPSRRFGETPVDDLSKETVRDAQVKEARESLYCLRLRVYLAAFTRKELGTPGAC